MNELVEIKDLKRSFAGKRALNGMTFSLGTGKIVGLLGENGAGKTTLFRVMTGLLTRDSGSVRIEGIEVGPKTNERISYVPDHFVFGGFRRISNAVTYMKMCFPDFDEKKAEMLLAKLHFTQDQKIASLSKGQKAQVQLVLLMSRKAKLYLLDEPLAAVDPATREFIIKTILSTFGEDNTVLISTHVVMDIELILDEVVMIKDGRVHLQGETDELREKYGKTINEIFKDEFRYVEGGTENE
ncbi:MAG: ABC transporter ATP-binding protein [Clostridiales bacterium]|nr:ABC transporter ATP-binding protein [Clostridiales bacterium]